MIGYIGVGASFYKCIRYCLEDKIGLSEQQKIEKSLKDHLQHKNRAEILDYNKCFGNLAELTVQFLDVARLSTRVKKPVFHFFLRPSPDDKVSHNQLIEMGKECVNHFGIADNQYLIILHKDTNAQHIHIVANRVGFDGKVAKDNHSYRKMDSLCRQLEKQFQLKEVLSARRFLPEEFRHLPRYNSRKEKIKTDIRDSLKQVNTFQQFEEQMESIGYKILKDRAILFIDKKKAKIKGSEVGFSLANIQQILHLKQELAIKQEKQKLRKINIQRDIDKQGHTPVQNPLLKTAHSDRQGDFELLELIKHLDKLLNDLLMPESTGQSVNPELLKEAKRLSKRKNLSK